MSRFRSLARFLERELHPYAIAARAIVGLLWLIHDYVFGEEDDGSSWNHNPWDDAYRHCDPATFEQ